MPVSSDTGYTGKSFSTETRFIVGTIPTIKYKGSGTPKVCWMHHVCDSEDVSLSLKSKAGETCAQGAGLAGGS